MNKNCDFMESLRSNFKSQDIEFSVLNDTLPIVKITNKFASAVISLYGCHILAYTPRDSRNVLWLSSHSYFEEGKPIRGGIPVCWPWFGPVQNPAHGVARISLWSLDRICDEEDHSTTLYFSLNRVPDLGLRAGMEINIGTALTCGLSTENAGHEAVTLTDALHTYLAVSSVEKVSVEGLDGALYLDKVDKADGKKQSGDVRITAETDRIYASDSTVILHDPDWARDIKVEKFGSGTTVVWNPWEDKARCMADFGDHEYHAMICVEAANAAGDARLLKPGQKHMISTRITQICR